VRIQSLIGFVLLLASASVFAEYNHDDRAKARVFAGVGYLAGCIELFVTEPSWSIYSKKTRQMKTREIAMTLYSSMADFPGTFVSSQMALMDLRQDLKFAKILRSQATSGAALLLGASTALLYIPEDTLYSAWRHPGVLVFSALTVGLSARFASKYADYNSQASTLRNRDRITSFLGTTSYSLDVTGSVLAYQIRESNRLTMIRTRRSETAHISFEYLLAAAAGLNAYLLGGKSQSTRVSGPIPSAVEPFFEFGPGQARVGVSGRF